MLRGEIGRLRWVCAWRHSVRSEMLAGFAAWLAAAALGLCFAGASQAAVVHEFLKPVSEELEKGVPAGCAGAPAPPCLTGPLSVVKALSADPGHVVAAERINSGKNFGKSRVDRLNDRIGAYAGPQIDEEASLEGLTNGVAMGHVGAAQRTYVGAGRAGENVVAAFGPSGKVEPEGVWSGKATTEGSFGGFGGVAVDDSKNVVTHGDVYVLAGGLVDVYESEAGTEPGKEPASVLGKILGSPEAPSVAGHFASPTAVAVSPASGEVLVADGHEEGCAAGSAECVIDVFEPTGVHGVYNFLFKITGPPSEPFKQIGQIAVDGEGNIYVVEKQANVVDQFDAAGDFLARIEGTPEGPFKELASVTADPENGSVYVGDFDQTLKTGAIDAYAKGAIVPDVVTSAGQAQVRLGGGGEGEIEATLSGTVNPLNEGAASCAFAWGQSKALGKLAHCSAEVANANGPEPVQATIKTGEGLAPDSTYLFRLQASNKHGTNPGKESDDKELLTPGPGIQSASATDASSSSVTLNASIDPNNAPTSYYFQYGRSEYEAQSPIASLGAGKGQLQVTPRHIQGLSPGALYHYRVVAVSELEVQGKMTAVPFPGPDQTFTTQGAAGTELPDGRRWELVSPPNKHGAVLGSIRESGVTQAAAGGNALTYQASLPTEEGAKGYIYGSVQVLASRGEGGWSSKDVSLEHGAATNIPVGAGGEYRAFSEDLTLALVEPIGEFSSLAEEASPPDSEATPYIRHDATCESTGGKSSCFEPLVTGAAGYADVPGATQFGGKAHFIGASGDLTHAILESGVALTGAATSGNNELYEFSAQKPASERLELVSLLPANGEGKEEPVEAAVSLGLGNEITRHALSEDGSRIVFSAGSHLYMRDTAIGVKGQSVQLDAPEAACLAEGECGEGEENAIFQAAASDGSRVLFSDTERLTKNAGRLPGKADLYECVIEEMAGKLRCTLSDLTPAPSAHQSADVQGSVLGASEDGTWVYFAANGVLGDGAARGALAGSCNGSTGEGQCNLYVSHEGQTHLIGIVAGADYPDWEVLAKQTARVSPDGEWLAFMSQRPLTGYDNEDVSSGKPGERMDEEVFLYHAEGGGAGRLSCASCDPSGARPVGVEYARLEGGLVGGFSVWNHETWIAANVPGWTPYEASHALYQSRYLSNSGRLFFNSNDALVPQDINRNQDVYEFEPAGVGSCTSQAPGYSAATGGCVALVSSGRAAGESAFLDASENGDDVFFLTGERLVPKDVDTAVDIYDAHVCSAGAPCAQEAEQPPACTTAEACRAAPAPQPSIFGQPSSATFSGQGNVAPPAPPAPPKALSNAQKLAKALSACRQRYEKAKKRRTGCERQAHKRYPAKAARKKSGKR